MKTCFPTPIIAIWQMKEKKEGQLHFKKHCFEKPRSHAEMILKSAPQKLNFLMAKAISKRYTLDCSS